jgi:hypothetical protein
VVKASLDAEKKTKFFGEPAWSVELSMARQKVSILKKCLSSIRTGLDHSTILKRDIISKGLNITLPTTLPECSSQLRTAAVAEAKQIAGLSFHRRDTEQNEKIKVLEASMNNADKDQAVILRRLRQCEQIKQLFDKLKVVRERERATSMVKTATHARFDEGMNDLADAPPHVQALRLLSPDGHVPADRPELSPLNLEVTDDPFHRLDSVTQAIKCDHPTLGFEITACHIRKRGYVSGIAPSTSAARIRNVRRKYLGAYVVSVNDTPVFSCESVLAALTAATASDAASFTIVFAPDRYIPVSSRPNDSPIHFRSINSVSLTPLGPPRPLSQTQQHRSPVP